MPEMRCPDLSDLASRFQPLLRYDLLERWFPTLAEAWLSHCSPEDWGSMGARQRGTAIMLAPNEPTTFTASDVAGGCSDQSGTPIQLASTNDPNAIGNPAYTSHAADQDLFLDFAGWDNTNSYGEGSRNYLADVFSVLGASMSPSVTDVSGSVTPAPSFGANSQSKEPTVYAEAEWAGFYAAMDEAFANEKGQSDFDPSTRDALRSYFALTYYFLYPATELPPDLRAPETNVLLREGQWEAISLFFRGDPLDGRGERRPGSIAFENPTYVVYSTGYGRSDDAPARGECRPWTATKGDPAAYLIEKDGDHPVAYVTAGTHKNLFRPHVGTTTTTSAPNPWLLGAGGVLLTAAGVVAAYCTFATLAPPAAAACWIVAGILALVGLILMLLALIFKASSSSTQDPMPQGEERDFGRGAGPAATPAGGSPSTGPTGVPPGSAGAVEFALRIIDRFRLDPPATDFPPSQRCEHPTWWDFAGRWGVKIIYAPSNKWDSGSRRTDRFGRSRGYWNAYRMANFWASNPDGYGPAG